MSLSESFDQEASNQIRFLALICALATAMAPRHCCSSLPKRQNRLSLEPVAKELLRKQQEETGGDLKT